MGYASNIKDRDGACRDHLVIRQIFPPDLDAIFPSIFQ
jgi:hypothetical protein